MEFDEVVVKESPGLCRCCLSEGCYKDLGSEYSWMGDTEIYADMLLECFDIGVSQHAEGPNGPNRLICEVCITRLRDACNFKKQVLDSEKRFIDMLHRGDFKSKGLVFPSDMKQEAEALDVEYLDDLDFGDDAEDLLKTDTEAEPSQSEDITVASLPPVKRGRGRPRKSAATPVKPERRAKLAKLEDKPRSSKAAAKGDTTCDILASEDTLAPEQGTRIRTVAPEKSRFIRIQDGKCFIKVRSLLPLTDQIKNDSPNTKQLRKKVVPKRESTCLIDVPSNVGQLSRTKIHRLITSNITTILESSTVVPFKYKDRFYCFYCSKTFHDATLLKDHTLNDHKTSIVCDLAYLRRSGYKVKVDVTEIECRICEEKIEDLNSLIRHLESLHGKRFTAEVGYGLIPYKLRELELKCAICTQKFDYFVKLNQHMNTHYENFVCETCGKAFLSAKRLRTHASIHDTMFPCKECEDTFETIQERTLHVKLVHDTKMSLKCRECKKTFTSYSLRKNHYRSKHNIEIPTFDCPICNKQFHIKSRMKAHLRMVHEKERNYSCPMCEAKCFDAGMLRKHTLAKHIGERKYICDHCNKSYVRKCQLRVHITQVHKIKYNADAMFTCRLCDEMFLEINSLKLHIMNVHP